jgi:hypothetical protein
MYSAQLHSVRALHPHQSVPLYSARRGKKAKSWSIPHTIPIQLSLSMQTTWRARMHTRICMHKHMRHSTHSYTPLRHLFRSKAIPRSRGAYSGTQEKRKSCLGVFLLCVILYVSMKIFRNLSRKPDTSFEVLTHRACSNLKSSLRNS